MELRRLASFVMCFVLIIVGVVLTWYGNTLPQNIFGYMTAVGVSEATTTNILHVVGPIMIAVGAFLILILVFVRKEKKTSLSI